MTLALGSCPDSWGVWFDHDPKQTPWERFLDELQVVEVPFGERHWRTAVDAYDRFGRGRHPAGLNFGDCLAYASAIVADVELLYVGEDFRHTDVRAA